MAKTPKSKNDRRGSPKGSFANPKHEWSEHISIMVETHVAVGTPRAAIAEFCKVSVDTLERHYRKELDNGLHKANAAVGGRLFQMATGAIRHADGTVEKVDHKTALDAGKFWQDRRGGPMWRQRNQTDFGLNGLGDAAAAAAKPDDDEVQPLKVQINFVHQKSSCPDDLK